MNSEDTVILFITIILVLAGILFGIYQNKRRGELLTRQAEKRNGQVSKRGMLGRWQLLIPVRGQTMLVYSVPGSRYSPPKTFATLKSDSLRLPQIEIKRKGLVQKVFGSFGGEPVQTNDEEFDSQFVVKSDDSFSALRILSPDVKQRLLDRSMRSAQIKITPQEARLMILSIPSNDETYDNFIDAALSIFQKIL